MFFQRKDSLFLGRYAALFRNRSVFHGFSTRCGGISPPPYESLNLGTGSGDHPDWVEKNRDRFYRAMAIAGGRAAIPGQVHGNRVARVTEPGRIEHTDGLVTDTRGIALIVQIADCLPIFLFDPVHEAVGIVHAGWRGSVLGIASSAVTMMETHFGCRPEHVRAFIGPSIGPCCYRVQSDIARQFASEYVTRGTLDLWRCNADQLIEAGLHANAVEVSRICTSCNSDWFFSHRASGGCTGRMMAVIGLSEKP